MSSRRKNNKLVDLLSSPGGFQMTQAFTSPITSRLKGGLFNPLEFNPYLLFDAETSMSGTLESPTLDLDPSDESTLDVITATRAGVATYTDLHGNIKQAASDTVRVDYTQGEELTPTKYQRVRYTDIESNWNPFLGSTVEGDGLNGYSSYIFTSSGSYARPQTAVSTEDGQVYTGSFWARRVSGSGALLGWHQFSATGNATAALSVTNDWAFYSFQFLGKSGGGDINFGLAVEDSGDVVEIAMPQVEEGTTASDFVENTSGSPLWIASATYADRVPMILVEPSATNLVTNSTSFQTTGSVAQESGIDAPDGTNTATRITNISGASGTDAVYSIANSVSPSSEINGSIYLRGEAGKVVRLYVKRYSVGTFISTPAESVLLTGSWQRYESPSFTLNADNTNAAVALRNDGNTTADSVDLWGGQIESGSVATSYIPTSGSTAQRGRDDLTISGGAFTSFFNNSEGTFYVESVLNDGTSNTKFIFDATQGVSDSNRLTAYYVVDVLKTQISASGNLQVNAVIGNQPSANVLSRMALSYKVNNVQASLDGVNMATDTSATMPTGIDQIAIGSRFNDASYFNGHIKRLIYWPYHSDRL